MERTEAPPTPAVSYDTIVIGSGIAGFSAALALHERGRKVAVISASTGATSVSSGAWDFGPIPPSGSTVLDELRASRRWQSIYRRLLIEDKDFGAADDLKRSAEAIAGALASRLKLSFDFKRPFRLPTSAGYWKTTFGAHELQARADLAKLRNRRVGLVTSEHFRFRADLVARQWVTQAAAQGEQLDISPLWVHWNIPNADWSLPHLATRLQHDAQFRRGLISSLAERLEGSHYDLLLFPPLFLDSTTADAIQKELHVPVAECLCTVEPVAGYRLSTAISGTLKQLEIPFFSVSQLQAEVREGSAKGLRHYGPAAHGWQELRAQSYVLATGKHFGGGVKLGFEKVEESVFRLPLFSRRSDEEITRRNQLPWKEGAFRDEQIWARLGVWVDASFRPVDKTNAPVLRNVMACGSLIGGIDFARAALGLGLMAYTGRRCGQLA